MYLVHAVQMNIIPVTLKQVKLCQERGYHSTIVQTDFMHLNEDHLLWLQHVAVFWLSHVMGVWLLDP